MINTYKQHYKALAYLGFPIVVGQLGMIILGFADTLMIGRYGTAELGAASFVNNVFNLAIIFCTGFSYGLTPIVGMLYGKREFLQAGQALKCSIVANVLIGVLITLLMFILYLCVEHLGQPVELIPLIKPYFLTLLASLIFIMLFNAFRQFTDGITATKTAMWILLGGNLLNIAGNYLLIYGTFGFPELGLLGGGISTLFSRIVMVIVFMGVLVRGKRFRQYKIGFFRLKLSGKLIKTLNELGWPVGLQMGMETASFSLSAVMVGWLGTVALASHQVISTISTLAFMVYYGVGAAVAVRVSNFSGQKDWKNVRSTTYAGMHIILFLAFLFCVAIYLLRYQVGTWFTDSQDVVDVVVTLVMPVLLYQFGDGLQITFANALRGISDVKPMMWIAFFAYFIVSLPVGYFLGFVLEWGVVGVWLAFPFGLTTAGVLFFLRFRKRLMKYTQLSSR
ncbi:MATE family efflux transporter [Bacteroides sp. 214]|uniref:MATE family efflux transporter n=1 Tax=Bacteroides sp. 214 TaxID=2302935 RepID=UPI0019403024|nr:MATE family efflux transporter [Bacteroides sp. 214]